MKEIKAAWKGCDINTAEYVTLTIDEQITIRGNITGERNGTPMRVQYILTTDVSWIIQNVSITVTADTSYTLQFQRNRDGQWNDGDGKSVPALNECIDIDISLTPFTNTLPINRLHLLPGESQIITVLYFNLPKGEWHPMHQRYTNIDGRFYKYENLDGTYTTMLDIDENGLVVHYPGQWQRTYPLL